MKKLISMVMAAAMVVSLVPATAFADTGSAKAVAKVIDAVDVREGIDATTALQGTNVEFQLKVDGDGQYATGTQTGEHKLTFTLDGAEFKYTTNADQAAKNAAVKGLVAVAPANNSTVSTDSIVITEADKDSFKMTINAKLMDKDVISLKLGMANSIVALKSTSVGKKATIAVEGDLVKTDDLTFAEVKDKGIQATVKKVAEVAAEESTHLERDLKIKSNVNDFAQNQVFELKLSNGFEFGTLATSDGFGNAAWNLVKWDGTSAYTTSGVTATEYKGETKAYIQVAATSPDDEIVVASDAIEIVADSAKAGAECKLTVKAIRVAGDTFSATADAVVVAKVVSNEVTLSVDKDDDVPVIYSGVNVANYGITDDSDHKSLEVTLKESAKGALNVKKSFTLTLPEGVYATDVDVTDAEGAYIGNTASATAVEKAFATAYKKGDQETFEFARKTFTATDDSAVATADKKMDLDFKLTLIAEPGFEGDVTLTLGGDAFDKEQKVTIAKFVSPYKVEASQNDMIIDYRNTKVPTNVVVKEAEAGLWKKDEMTFDFNFDRREMDLEDDAKFTVDDKSGMEVKNTKNMKFTVKDESGDEPAAVTISNISLYMNRSIAAGAYDLKLETTAGTAMMTTDRLFTTKDGETGSATALANTGVDAKPYYAADYRDWDVKTASTAGSFVAKSFTVKEGFVNVITAGRDQDDASFTKKVVVPVGEKYLIAGEEQVALDVPAYISAQGYTMLPVRAVATALGINNNNVLWNQASRTVTILYGQRIITMVAGQKVVTVNGNTIPASATVQIKDGRTFLPMRDLATALGVTDITWDAATKTATMNGNQNK